MSGPFIRRPIATLLLVLAAVLLGIGGYRALPVAALPNVDFPTIQVTTPFPGASPEVIETSITAPLEHYFGTISGLASMSSTSAYGLSEITLRFDLARSLSAAAQDVQSQIAAAAGWMPVSELPGPPTYRLVNPADTPVLILALTSQTLPLDQVSDLANNILIPKLSQISGVGAVTAEGSVRRAIRVQIDPAKLAGLGMTMEDLRTIIPNTSSNLPKGTLDGARQAFQVDANDQLFTAYGYRNTIMAYRNGAPVYLRDIGNAVDGLEDSELAGWFNGHPAIIVDIQRQPGANTIAVVKSVFDALPQLKASLPPGLKIEVVADRTITIHAAIADVQFTFLLTLALVVLVIFLFLRKFWATVIPSVVLPVSMVATFGVMAVLGFSLDNLSMMALTIASGFVVDDAIVMIENIVRRIEMGETPLQAALKGSQQIGFTIVSLTVSLIAVFIPLLLMSGIVGRLFREFAITLSASVIVSAVISLTLTPMMCAQLLRPESAEATHGALFRWTERGFDALLSRYVKGLDWVLRHWSVGLAVAGLTVVATVLLYVAVPKGFLPNQDTGLLVGVTDAAEDISFAAMSDLQQQVAEVLGHDPDVRGVASFVGVGTANPTLNTGRLYINIGPPGERTVALPKIMARLLHSVASLRGISLHLQAVQDIELSTRATRTQYQYVMQDLDEGELLASSDKLVAVLRKHPEFADVVSDRQDHGSRLSVAVDRTAAARLGVSLTDIDQALYDAFGQRQISTVYGPVSQYHVILEVNPAARRDPAALDKLFLRPSFGPNGANSAGTQVTSSSSGNSGSSASQSSSGAATQGTPGQQAPAGTMAIASAMTQQSLVPLAAVARFERSDARLTIEHQGLFPAATISFNLAPGVSLGKAIELLHQAEHDASVPNSVTASLSGAAAEFDDSLAGGQMLILAALVTVYIVLGVLYESFIHPLTILSTLPSAGVGALAALIVCGMELNLVSLIGIILLIGIVKKNGIMMVDFALQAERERGASPFDAIREACILRFRPIMMTTMAALFGALPLALGTGTGSELRRPLGVAIVGGLVVSQVLTLYTTPIIYIGFDWLRRAFDRRARVPSAPQQAAEGRAP